jgi:hypothetical protein
MTVPVFSKNPSFTASGLPGEAAGAREKNHGTLSYTLACTLVGRACVNKYILVTRTTMITHALGLRKMRINHRLRISLSRREQRRQIFGPAAFRLLPPRTELKGKGEWTLGELN